MGANERMNAGRSVQGAMDCLTAKWNSGKHLARKLSETLGHEVRMVKMELVA